MTALKSKVVVVTGASSGIGKACVEALSGAGNKVVLAARNEEKMRKIASQLNGESLVVPTDVSKKDDCENLIKRTIDHFGQIDVLINNAGISMRALLEDLDLEVLERVMAINFWGTVYCTKFALPYIKARKGSIVGVSSIAGFKGLPGRTGYSASKFAMHGFLESLRIENMKTGVHVMLACPGYTSSNIRNTALNAKGNAQGESPFDEGKLMSAEAVANHIVRGIEKRKRTLVLTGLGKATVTLNKFFPAWLDRMTYNKISKEKDSPFK